MYKYCTTEHLAYSCKWYIYTRNFHSYVVFWSRKVTIFLLHGKFFATDVLELLLMSFVLVYYE